MRRINNNLWSSVINIISIIVFLIGLFFKNSYILIIGQLISLMIMTIRVRKCQLLLIVCMFLFLYFVPFVLYFFFDIGLSAYTAFNYTQYFLHTLICQSAFLLVIQIFTKSDYDFDSRGLLDFKLYDNKIIYYICIFAMIITILYGKSGDTIFTRGGYGEIGRYVATALYEYTLIFYLIAYFFSGNYRFRVILLKLISVVFCIRSLLFGGRIEVLEMIIMMFALFYRDRFKTKTIIILAVAAYLLFSLYGDFRSDFNLNNFNFGRMYGYDYYNNRVVNNESEVIYTSTVILSSINSNIIDNAYRHKASMIYLLRLILPSSITDSRYNVVVFLQKNYSLCGGGGFLSAFLYFYFGIFGIIVCGAFIGTSFNYLRKNKNNQLFQIFIISLLAMSPRWYAYSPESIIKIPLYTVIIYLILSKICYKSAI